MFEVADERGLKNFIYDSNASLQWKKSEKIEIRLYFNKDDLGNKFSQANSGKRSLFPELVGGPLV